jgi:hypothetical protein
VLVISSPNGVPIRLTVERWGHIERRHPEMAEQKERVLETVAEPETVYRGDEGALLAVRRYSKTPLTEKFLVAVFREVSREDGFIVTAYFTNRPATGREVVWKRSES